MPASLLFLYHLDMYAVITWHEQCNGQTHVHQMLVVLLHSGGESKLQVTEKFYAPGFTIHIVYSDTLLTPCWPIFILLTSSRRSVLLKDLPVALPVKQLTAFTQNESYLPPSCLILSSASEARSHHTLFL
jgi:hypothetical protein